MFTKLLFGTAGIPLCAKHTNTVGGIAAVRQLGLEAMELEFVQSVNISAEKAAVVKEAAHKNNIILTCHAPYYINLNSLDSAKRAQSRERLLKAARIGKMCGAWSVAFHAAFNMKMHKDVVYENVKRELSSIMETLRSEGNDILLRPELMGRETQWGSLEELITLCSELDTLPCIDFAHLHARGGKYNTYEEFCAALAAIEKGLGRAALDNMHIHIAGVRYSSKGELNHLPLEESDLRFRDIVQAWRDFGIKGVVISESPNIEKDAILLKNLYDKQLMAR